MVPKPGHGLDRLKTGKADLIEQRMHIGGEAAEPEARQFWFGIVQRGRPLQVVEERPEHLRVKRHDEPAQQRRCTAEGLPCSSVPCSTGRRAFRACQRVVERRATHDSNEKEQELYAGQKPKQGRRCDQARFTACDFEP